MKDSKILRAKTRVLLDVVFVNINSQYLKDTSNFWNSSNILLAD